MARSIFATKMPLRMQGESAFAFHPLYFLVTLLAQHECITNSAYKDAMDIQKHGGNIYLPQHLHENLPKGCRHLLASKDAFNGRQLRTVDDC